MNKSKVLLAGATGYLGGYVMQELLAQHVETKVITRDRSKIKVKDEGLEIIEAEVTQPHTLKDICVDTDVVISSVGITRQKDGLTYMDVDYQANANLLDEAKRAGAKKFIYVSVLRGDEMRQLKICEAKERFVDELKASGLEYCIIRPNGFFSDMGDFLQMAKGGRVFLFGNGEMQLNPIHGADLAAVCVQAMQGNEEEINIGGPNTLSQNQIAELALKAYGKRTRIIHFPDWMRRFSIWAMRTFTSSKTYGPVEFFLTTMAMDMKAPEYGTHTLEDFFNNSVHSQK